MNICNCNHISHIISFHISPKCCKEKEHKDDQLCIAVHTINNICDVEPLDNLSIKSIAKQALPCITMMNNKSKVIFIYTT